MRNSLYTAIPTSRMWSYLDIMILAFYYRFYAKNALGKIKPKQITNLKIYLLKLYDLSTFSKKKKEKGII